MPNVTIRDLPASVHHELVRRAEDAGLSLQRYLVTELSRLASRPTMPEVLERIERRSGGRVGSEIAVRDIEEGRRAG